MKKSVKIILIVLAALLVVSGTLVAVFWDTTKNFVAKTTKTPTEYYTYVENANLENTASALYGLLNVDEATKEFKIAQSSSAKLELGEGISEVFTIFGVEDAVDISWFKSVEASFVSNNSNKKSGGDFKLALNDKELVSGAFVADIDNDNIYFSVPLLTDDKFIKISTKDLLEDEEIVQPDGCIEGTEPTIFGKLMGEDMTYIYDVLPTEEVLSKLLVKYFNIIVNNLGEAEKSSADLTIGNVTQSCTLITLVIDEKEFYEALKSVLTEAKADKEIEKIVRDFAKAIEENEDEAYSSFSKGIDEALADLDESLETVKEKTAEELSKETVTLKTWVDRKGNVVARALIAEDGELFIGTTKDGSKVATEARFSAEEDEDSEEIITVKFSGQGEIDGQKLKGEYKALYNDKAFLKINVKDFDLGGLKKDFRLLGDFTVSVGENWKEIVFDEEDDEEIPDEVISLIDGLEIEFSAKEKSGSFEIFVNGKSGIKLSAEATEKEYTEPVIPDDSKVLDIVEDEEALYQMLENFDPQVILDKLLEAGIPQEIIDEMLAPDEDYEDEWDDSDWDEDWDDGDWDEDWDDGDWDEDWDEDWDDGELNCEFNEF